MNKRIAKKQLKQKLMMEDMQLDNEIKLLKKQIKQKQKQVQKLKAQSRLVSSLKDNSQVVKKIKLNTWKNIDVSKEVGKKKYTEGQKNYIRALKYIESKISKAAADLTAVYGSDDIEELANQYYVSELGNFSEDELKEIEEEFNKTHGYKIRIKQGSNPFAGIDFDTLMPN